MIEFEPVIGLEVHVQLLTESKAFCGAAAQFGGEPNANIDPYTLGLPGTLPVLNRRAVEFGLRLGLAAGCHIRPESRFARKHYFYPDLPKGYQISQYDEPLCEGGAIDFILQGERRSVPLIRIHMEEDAGKNVHEPGTGRSLLDLNRAGVPLLEVVSAPALRGAEEAAEYLRALRRLVRYLGISDGNMEEGSLRCDVNVSLRPVGETKLGTRTELKNINSFRNVQRAIEHEVGRQTDILRKGGTIVMETRGFDGERGTSRSQRSKEEAHDYRYLPDPDLPPLSIDDAWLERVRAGLPELPLQRRERFITELGLSPYDAGLLSAERELADYFDAALAAAQQNPLGNDARRAVAKALANWIGSELMGALNRDGKTLAQAPLGPDVLAELVLLVHEATISGKSAKEVFAALYAEPGPRPRDIVAARGLALSNDDDALRTLCRAVVADPAHHKQVQRYRAGQTKLLGFFVGQVLQRSGGKAAPERANAILVELLSESPAS